MPKTRTREMAKKSRTPRGKKSNEPNLDRLKTRGKKKRTKAPKEVTSKTEPTVSGEISVNKTSEKTSIDTEVTAEVNTPVVRGIVSNTDMAYRRRQRMNQNSPHLNIPGSNATAEEKLTFVLSVVKKAGLRDLLFTPTGLDEAIAAVNKMANEI